MKINKYLLLVFCFAFSFLPLISASAQGETPHVFDTTMSTSTAIRSAVDTWLASNAPVPLPYWAITGVDKTNEETGNTFVCLVALDISAPTDNWHVTDENLVKWMGTIIVHADNTVEVYSDGGYDQQASKGSAKVAAPFLDGGGANVRFPWQRGATMMYGTRGIHDAGGGADYAVGFSAVDFLGGDDLGSGVASNKVYAVANGQVDYWCGDQSATIVRTKNENTNDYYIYAHMLNNEMLQVGYTFYQGDYMGNLKYGTFDDNCGWAEQTAQHYHLHFGFKPASGAFTMEGCTLSMSTKKWICGTKEVSTGQYLQGGSGGVTIIGEDGGALPQQYGFWDYIMFGAVSLWDMTIVKNLPDHTTNQFLYALYNGVSVAVRIARVMVYSNINLGHFFAVFFFAVQIKMLLGTAEFIVFLAKAYKSLMSSWLGG